MNSRESYYLHDSATITNMAEAVKGRSYDNSRRQARVPAPPAQGAAAAPGPSKSPPSTAQSRIARTLAERHQLTVTEADAADIIYTLMSPEVHRILTIERQWSADRYQKWLATTLQTQLLTGPH